MQNFLKNAPRSDAPHKIYPTGLNLLSLPDILHTCSNDLIQKPDRKCSPSTACDEQHSIICPLIEPASAPTIRAVKHDLDGYRDVTTPTGQKETKTKKERIPGCDPLAPFAYAFKADPNPPLRSHPGRPSLDLPPQSLSHSCSSPCRSHPQ